MKYLCQYCRREFPGIITVHVRPPCPIPEKSYQVCPRCFKTIILDLIQTGGLDQIIEMTEKDTDNTKT